MSREALQRGRPDVLFHWVLLGLCTIVLVLASVMSVRGGRQVLLPGVSVALPELCTMKRLWGIDCPGCGMTRAFIALAHGDVSAAWSFNPAAILLFGMMAFQAPYRAVQLVRVYRGQRELSLGYLPHIALVTLAVGILGQWALRMGGVAF
jgi:hypothetical protein